MIFKEFQSLVDKAGSRYGLIISVTKRARAIKDGEAPLVNTNFEKTVSIGIENIESKNESKFSKLKRNIFSVPFRKFAIKYGVILLVLSIFTPFKTYYILSGILLILFGIFQNSQHFSFFAD